MLKCHSHVAPRRVKWRVIDRVLVTVWLMMSSDAATAHPQVAQAWSAIFQGSGNGDDYSRVMTVDNLGNVYVADRSRDGTNYNFVTVKIDGGGNLVWLMHFDTQGSGYDGPKGIAVDAAGNVYVTGSIANHRKFTTLKYDANGQLAWVASYARPGEPARWPREDAVGLVLDKGGNVYVSGYSQTSYSFEDYEYVTLKYDARGNASWTNRLGQIGGDSGPAGIGTDDFGNIYVAGHASSDGMDENVSFVAVKYDPSGLGIWTNRINVGYGWTACMAVDKCGNVFVAGRGPTVKFGVDGNVRWSRPFPASFAAQIATDRMGNVVVTGEDGSSEPDVRTVKYDADGNQLWSVVSRAGDANQARNLAIDDAGSVYLAVNTRTFHDSRIRFDATVFAYSATGSAAWSESRQICGEVVGLAVDTGGNVFATRSCGGAVVEVVKYTQPYAPPLLILAGTGGVLLSWPGLATNVVVETSSDLSSRSSWQVVTNDPSLLAGRNVVTNRITGTHFHRLRAR